MDYLRRVLKDEAATSRELDIVEIGDNKMEQLASCVHSTFIAELQEKYFEHALESKPEYWNKHNKNRMSKWILFLHKHRSGTGLDCALESASQDQEVKIPVCKMVQNFQKRWKTLMSYYFCFKPCSVLCLIKISKKYLEF